MPSRPRRLIEEFLSGRGRSDKLESFFVVVLQESPLINALPRSLFTSFAAGHFDIVKNALPSKHVSACNSCHFSVGAATLFTSEARFASTCFLRAIGVA